MYSDYHVHSRFSFDSDEEPERIINSAISLGMNQICFTEHHDFNWPVSGEFPLVDFIEYNSVISSLQNKYNNRIQILKGIELGLVKNASSLYKELFSKESFDFVIGSCHIVDNMDPYYSDFWKNRFDRDAFELYFKTTYDVLKEFNQIDSLGHMDYIVRYSPNKDSNYSVFDYYDIIDEILKLMIHNEIKLEINTANLRKGFCFPNPHTDIIKRYTQLGGRYVTIGSDAHDYQSIGSYFDIAEDIVKKFNLKIYKVQP